MSLSHSAPETDERPKKKQNKDIGYNHWIQVRQEWTRGQKAYDPNENGRESYKSHPLLADVQPSHFDTIYTSLVEGKRFVERVPLSFVITTLVVELM